MTTLEQQVHSIESATLNYETLRVMKDAGQVLKKIHNGMKIDDVENVMYVSSSPIFNPHTCFRADEGGGFTGRKSAKVRRWLGRSGRRLRGWARV